MAFDTILDEPIIHAAYRSFTVEVPNPPSDLTRTYIEYSYSLDNSVYSDWIPLTDLDSSTITFTHSSLGLFNEFAEHRDIPVPPDIFADPTAFAVLNPSFDTSIANWTADNGTYLVRDTVSFDTAPGSLKATPASATFTSGLNICHGDISGIFIAGEQYSLDFQYTLIGQLGSGGSSASAILGSASDSNSAIFTSSVSALSSLNSAGAGADDASTGTITWANPGNITSSDNVYATAGFGLAGQVSHYLKATNFGFSLPAATINGIIVEIERSSAGAGGQKDSLLRLVRAGTVESVGDHADTVNFWPVSDTIKSYGSSSDLWGAAWTSADINSSSFGVALAATTTGTGASTTSVDFIRITVYYTPTSAFRLVTLKWTPHTTTSNPSITFRPNDSNSIQLSIDSFVLSKPPSSSDLSNIYQTYDPATLAAANTIPIYYRYKYKLITRSGDSDWSDTAYAGQVRTITTAEVEPNSITQAQISAPYLSFVNDAPITGTDTTTSLTYVLLSNADQVSNITLTDPGLIMVSYTALWSNTTGGNGRVGIFINGVQLSASSSGIAAGFTAVEAVSGGTANIFTPLSTSNSSGIVTTSGTNNALPVTTGFMISPEAAPILIYLDPGTYTVSVQYKNNIAGTCSVKNRRLSVWKMK